MVNNQRPDLPPRVATPRAPVSEPALTAKMILFTLSTVTRKCAPAGAGQLVKILCTRMNVRLGDPDIPDVKLLTCGRHQLHDPDRTDAALRVLIQLRLLKPLGREHQGVEIVLLAILLKIRHRLPETLEPGTLRVVVNLLDKYPACTASGGPAPHFAS